MLNNVIVIIIYLYLNIVSYILLSLYWYIYDISFALYVVTKSFANSVQCNFGVILCCFLKHSHSQISLVFTFLCESLVVLILSYIMSMFLNFLAFSFSNTIGTLLRKPVSRIVTFLWKSFFIFSIALVSVYSFILFFLSINVQFSNCCSLSAISSL